MWAVGLCFSEKLYKLVQYDYNNILKTKLFKQ